MQETKRAPKSQDTNQTTQRANGEANARDEDDDFEDAQGDVGSSDNAGSPDKDEEEDHNEPEAADLAGSASPQPTKVRATVLSKKKKQGFQDNVLPEEDKAAMALNKQGAPPRQPQQQQLQEHEVVVQEVKKDDGKSPLKLRLDLNLDIEIELKAKIHGDITLTLL